MVVVPQSLTKTSLGLVIHHNPWLEPKGQPLVKLSDSIFEEVEETTPRESKRKPRKDALERRRKAVGSILCSLAETALLGGVESAIALDARKRAGSRYDRGDFHNGVLVEAVRGMARLGCRFR